MSASTQSGEVELEIEEIRHVVTDRGPMHLVANEEAQYAICGNGSGGLRKFGRKAETMEDAAKLGAWVNAREDMCEECREAFNDALFSEADDA